jgi:hypothetical protein
VSLAVRSCRPLLAKRRQRVDGCVPNTHLEVKVGSARETARAGPPNDGAVRHRLADAHRDTGEVRIHRLHAGAVVNGDEKAIAPCVPTGEADASGARRADACPNRRCVVDTGVEAVVARPEEPARRQRGRSRQAQRSARQWAANRGERQRADYTVDSQSDGGLEPTNGGRGPSGVAAVHRTGRKSLPRKQELERRDVPATEAGAQRSLPERVATVLAECRSRLIDRLGYGGEPAKAMLCERAIQAIDRAAIEPPFPQTDLQCRDVGIPDRGRRSRDEHQRGDKCDNNPSAHFPVLGRSGRELEPQRPSALLLAAVLAAVLGGCAGNEPSGEPEPGPVHVHGLGINPAGGALMIATHTGLWRLAAQRTTAVRVGDSRQDTMGFTVVGPDHFLASGHPEVALTGDEFEPHLGLIESQDGGRTWDGVSMAGEADFHVLRLEGERIFGINARTGELLISRNRGESWVGVMTPSPFVDVVVSPVKSNVWVAVGDDGLYGTSDNGASWVRFNSIRGLLAWPETRSLYVVALDGTVHLSRDAGTRFVSLSRVATPRAFLATDAMTLYVAAHDGTIYLSRDGGRSWQIRSPARTSH